MPVPPGKTGETPAPQKRSFGRMLILMLFTHAAAAIIAAGLLFHYQPRWLIEYLYPRPRAAVELDPLVTAPNAYHWTEQPTPAFPIPPYARFLKNVTIVLDPGHVGQRDPGGGWKRGPTGLREAVVNLNVAKYLADFLESAGAKVILTRDQDVSLNLDDDVDLLERAEVANHAHADLLLSIHHNAADAPTANHTLVFYHAKPQDSPASLCAARHLLTGLNDALRLEHHVEVALQSDTTIYQSGFAVLRHAHVPAVLSESSFHSNPEQEARLRDPVYNRREAYGLFIGLCRWAQAGLPRVRIVESLAPRTSLDGPAAASQPGKPTPDGKPVAGGTVVVRLDDGLDTRMGSAAASIMPDTLAVELDGQGVAYAEDLVKGELRITLPAVLPPGLGTLHIDFQNIFGQTVLHPDLPLSDAPPPRPKTEPAKAPAKPKGKRGK